MFDIPTIPLETVAVNTDLRLYPLPNRITAILSRTDETAERMQARGEIVPRVIGLPADDFEDVDRIVRCVSLNRHTGRSVTWNGRHLVAV